MNARRSAWWVAGALVVTGLACVAVRLHAQQRAKLARGDTLWRVTYKVEFNANRAGAGLRVTVPRETPHTRIVRRDVQYAGLAAQRVRASRELSREIALVAPTGGRHTMTARFDLHFTPQGRAAFSESAAKLTAEMRAQYLRGADTIPTNAPLVLETLAGLQPADPTNLVHRIFDFCDRNLRSDDEDFPDDVPTVLRQRKASSLGCARAFVTLCRAAGVPARLVTGFTIEPAEDAELQYWAEAHHGGRWVPFDPVNGSEGVVPADLVPVTRDQSEIVRGTDIAALKTSLEVVRRPPGPGALRFGRSQIGVIFDLTRLPLDMHEMLAVILLLPLGGLVTALFRTVIGLRTFGTFTPTLLALSFVYADWKTGLLTFAVVLALGLTTRAVLDQLKLLVVPRLSALLTLVVLCIMLLVSVLDYFNLTPSTQAVILPMVILTMTIERFYLTSEEDSPGIALQQLAATVLVGACCYGVLRWQTVGQLVFTFPELHFFTIAGLVLLGRYSGYRLTELWRFRDLGNR
jgi:transglutaminase-like putative cysteine protease